LVFLLLAVDPGLCGGRLPYSAGYERGTLPFDSTQPLYYNTPESYPYLTDGLDGHWFLAGLSASLMILPFALGWYLLHLLSY
jgi:hypothetical protein